MPNEIFQVDAFAKKPFSGNPAGVMPLAEFFPDSRMQSIAAEMNLAETAFVVPRGDHFDLRWFSPTMEIDLCGHATLASAHVLWETGRLPPAQAAHFQTRSGELIARQSTEGIALDFPTVPANDANPPAGLIEALGVRPIYVGQSKFDYLVQVASAAEVRNARVDFGGLAKFNVRGVILTSVSDDPEYDFVSRFFAPTSGIDEDPATGSSHCTLGPFWQQRLGRASLRAFQASRRGGYLTVRVDGERTQLIGRAVTTLRGELLV